jgi:hypothetical protein
MDDPSIAPLPFHSSHVISVIKPKEACCRHSVAGSAMPNNTCVTLLFNSSATLHHASYGARALSARSLRAHIYVTQRACTLVCLSAGAIPRASTCHRSWWQSRCAHVVHSWHRTHLPRDTYGIHACMPYLEQRFARVASVPGESSFECRARLHCNMARLDHHMNIHNARCRLSLQPCNLCCPFTHACRLHGVIHGERTH